MLLELYRFKVKLFLGSFRASKAAIVLLLAYVLGTVPAAIGLSTAIVGSVRSGVDLTVYVNEISALVSSFLALVLFLSFRGFTAFDFEQSFIFTSPITPRRYLTASTLAEMTVYSLSFGCPAFIFLGSTVLTLGLSSAVILSVVFLMLFLLFFIFFLENSLSIVQCTRRDWKVKAATTCLIVLMLLPALGILTQLPLAYHELPYPSTFFAMALLEALYDRLPSTTSLLGLASYLLISLALFLYSSKENFFQFANAVPFVSPFDVSMKMQTIKMGKNIRLFSRAGLAIKLTLGTESLLSFLMKKELVRMTRDGSFFAVLVFYLIVSVMSVVGRMEQAPFPVWLLVLAIYSLAVPMMLIGNWRIGELDNLWIPLTSAVDLGCVIKSLLYDLTLIAFTVPAVTIVVLTFVSHIDPFVPLVLVGSVSMIGCSTNLFTMMHFLEQKRRATPLLMVSWASMLLSGLLTSPTYAYVMASSMVGLTAEANLLTGVLVVAYSSLVFRFLSRMLEGKALRIEI